MGEVMQPAHRQPRLRFQSGLGLDSCAAHIRMSGCVPALKQTFLPPYASPNLAPGFECRMKNAECRSLAPGFKINEEPLCYLLLKVPAQPWNQSKAVYRR